MAEISHKGPPAEVGIVLEGYTVQEEGLPAPYQLEDGTIVCTMYVVPETEDTRSTDAEASNTLTSSGVADTGDQSSVEADVGGNSCSSDPVTDLSTVLCDTETDGEELGVGGSLHTCTPVKEVPQFVYLKGQVVLLDPELKGGDTIHMLGEYYKLSKCVTMVVPGDQPVIAGAPIYSAYPLQDTPVCTYDDDDVQGPYRDDNDDDYDQDTPVCNDDDDDVQGLERHYQNPTSPTHSRSTSPNLLLDSDTVEDVCDSSDPVDALTTLASVAGDNAGAGRKRCRDEGP